jgi:hypothetical protein
MKIIFAFLVTLAAVADASSLAAPELQPRASIITEVSYTQHYYLVVNSPCLQPPPVRTPPTVLSIVRLFSHEARVQACKNVAQSFRGFMGRVAYTTCNETLDEVARYLAVEKGCSETIDIVWRETEWRDYSEGGLAHTVLPSVCLEAEKILEESK